MNLFGKLPQEQAMQTMIHDTNMGFSNIRSSVNTIRSLLEQQNIEVPYQIHRSLFDIEQSTRFTTGVIDKYYEKFKANFPDSK